MGVVCRDAHAPRASPSTFLLQEGTAPENEELADHLAQNCTFTDTQVGGPPQPV
jgi:hypothetical protein